MIELNIKLTLSQFTAISEIITPDQLQRIQYVIENPNNVQKLPFKPSKPINVIDKSGKGFQRPIEHLQQEKDDAWNAVNADPNAQPDSPIGTIEPTATRKKGGGKGVKIAAFGRTQKQIDAYVESEAERTEELDEETIFKKERADEREANKAEKKKISDEKKETANKVQQEIDDIKKADEEVIPLTSLIESPWKDK